MPTWKYTPDRGNTQIRLQTASHAYGNTSKQLTAPRVVPELTNLQHLVVRVDASCEMQHPIYINNSTTTTQTLARTCIVSRVAGAVARVDSQQRLAWLV